MPEKSGFVIDAQFIAPPDGVIVRNFCFDNEPQFKSKNRTKKLEHFVLHETAGRSAKGCKKTLLRRNYGVHLILDREGIVTCHGDLANDVMSHANQLNKTSIGIEVVNPYAPKLAKGMSNIETIPASWWTWCPNKKDRRYVLPTAAQLKTLLKIVPFLCEKLGIPYVFPTKELNKKQRKIKGWRLPPRAKPNPGVVAHSDFASHADGRYLLEYLIKNSLSN
jgi:hypothetical protein